MTFNEYLDTELSKPTSDWYDPHGNSSRAVVTRMRSKGLFYSICWEYREFGCDLNYFLTKEFSGLDTPIIWFLKFLFIPIVLFPAPYVRTYVRYKRAINWYKFEYETQKLKGL